MIPNSIRKTIHIISERIFDGWWDWYYTFFNHAPRHHYEVEGDEWIFEHWDEDPYDSICFPLPLRVNCLGCTGCKTVPKPPFGQDKPKGSYKVFFHSLFLEQYDDMFGRQATFDLVNDMRQCNDEVNLIHLTEDKTE